MAVTQPDADIRSDRKKINSLKQFIKAADRPFFAHAHLLNTHGPLFSIESKVFSDGQKQDKPWIDNFYDDAILQYDTYIKEIIQFLKDEDLYNKTLLILNTDHGYKWTYDEPIPLMIRFPNNQRTGIISANSQRLDIAPTILAYLGIPQPEWMEGRSLLNIEHKSIEPIFITKRSSRQLIGGWVQTKPPKPPFYTLGQLSMIYCDRIYKLRLKDNNYRVQRVDNHTAPCDVDDIPSYEEGHKMLINHLKQAKYNTLSINIVR
ncbi:sulfatase-like hydrolase/transferase [Candidatus Pacearchaeota archaeon]|nr:sulfatase-like hydrolase/transferase [Candidatus Pacearchaeota archaeon]